MEPGKIYKICSPSPECPEATEHCRVTQINDEYYRCSPHGTFIWYKTEPVEEPEHE